ncbi:MAG: hypothetical protein N2745_07705 [Syntrophorhabdaceae bacterium]|nr:hypothetical protein [Syntrophorhabdaceae bacterium]
MLFTSIRYILFLSIIVLIARKLPLRFHKLFLVIVSYLFYMDWFPQYGILIFIQTAVTYILARGITRDNRYRKQIFLCAICFNIGVLSFFKYTNFILENIGWVSSRIGYGFDIKADIILPLGISFFTFEFIHYLVDVYRGSPPIKDFLEFVLFPAFFPTQIAGPIKRYQDFIPQINTVRRLTSDEFIEGIRIIIRGLFKKIVVADNLANVVQAGFNSYGSLGAIDTWIVVIAFSLQIYFDFSGYTDIARGSALLLGYRVPENFNIPYLARNISDFWQRWHITLSLWIRDYLYIPLGGNRYGTKRTYFNLFTTMTLAGLWHGAAWTYVIWGMLHGLGLIVHREWQRISRGFTRLGDSIIWRICAWAITFVFVSILWVLFRSSSIEQAWEMVKRIMFIGTPRLLGNLDPDHWLTTLCAIFCYGLYLIFKGGIVKPTLPNWIRASKPIIRPFQMASMVSLILAFPGTEATFIYFQF